MTRTRIAIAGLALLTTACGGTVGGDAKPGTTAETPSSAPSNAMGDTTLTTLKPCDLISSAEATSLSLSSPKQDKLAGSDICQWSSPGYGGVSVSLEAKTRAEDLTFKDKTKTSSKFGKYDGFIAKPQRDDAQCSAVISFSDSSSVHVIANGGALNPDPGSARACELATKSAEFVAAKLP